MNKCQEVTSGEVQDEARLIQGHRSRFQGRITGWVRVTRLLGRKRRLPKGRG